ncbi:MAG: nucleoside phosphorylase [Thermoplasmata archaeon]
MPARITPGPAPSATGGDVERQYHIALAPGELAESILLCGDPARAERVAGLFDEGLLTRKHREFVTHTGRWRGLGISVMSTGIGPDNTEIALVEISRICRSPVLIRIGSSGALRPEVRIGDLIISTGAVRLENTSTFFVHEGYPAIAHHEVVLALLTAAVRKKVRHHLGLTATAPGFYGAQCRKVEGFPLRWPGLIDELAGEGVLNLEMETSALLTLAALRGFRAGAVCAVYAHRPSGKFAGERERWEAEGRCVEVGMEALRILHKMDEEKRRAGREHWVPEHLLDSS